MYANILDTNELDFIVYNALKNLEILANNFLYRLDFTRKYLWLEFIEYSYHTFIYCFYTHIEVFFFFLFFFLFSIILSLVYSSKLSFYGIFIINFSSLLSFWLYTLYNFNHFILENGVLYINLWKWFILWGNLVVYFDIYIDSLSYSYILLVLTIAVGVNLYLFSYFRYEPNIDRFLIFINCFVISMIFLVSSGNLICFYLGWELIGLSSFFLINFWCTRVGTIKSAFKAYTFNKFSDISLLVSILLIIFITYDFNILNFNLQISNYQNKIIHFLGFDISFIEMVSFFFLISAFIKSAQFGTHIWLPDSMEAPVPASALIHSATLVSAGVFLILRFFPLFELSNYAFYIIGLVGSFTAFFGGCSAAFQSDAKRILAYSTISHCGFLIFSCISKIPEITIYYLYVHGFFKAAVFLCVGNVIHSSYNYQDFRRFGNSIYYLFFEFFFIIIGLMNLCGLPFTLGFYMKHFLFLFMIKNFIFFYLILFFIIGGALTGFFYSSRLLFYVFFDFKKGKKYMYIHTNRNTFNNYNFFSKNSLGNNISILYLFLVGSIISWFYYNIFFNYAMNFDSLDLLNLNSISFFESLNTNINFLTFVSFINWFFVGIIFIVIFFSWRKSFFYKLFFNNFFNLVLVFIFLYLFL